MKTAFISLLLLWALGFISCKGPEVPGPKNPDPGEFSSVSNSSNISMAAKLNGADWSADYVQARETGTKDQQGNVTYLLELRGKIGKDDNPNRLPGLILALTNRNGDAFTTGKIDLKSWGEDPSDGTTLILSYEDESGLKYGLDYLLTDTYAEIDIQTINETEIMGTWKMELVSANGDFLEFIEGTFNSDNFQRQSF